MYSKRNTRGLIAAALLVAVLLLPAVVHWSGIESPVEPAGLSVPAAPAVEQQAEISEPSDSDLLPPPANADKPAFVPDQLLVQFDAGVSASRRAELVASAGASVIKEFQRPAGLVQLQLPRGSVVDATAQMMAAYDEVTVAEPNILYYKDRLPNDPEFDRLWGLNNTGQSGGDPDVDINAPEAWSQVTGSTDIVIGVIDTGIDYRHVDLAPNIWRNTREIAGNGTDDDGNGWVDDIHGIDPANNDSDPLDDDGHGTHVAGIIAARGNNSKGITGVMWQAKLVSCKFLNEEGSGALSDALACLNYFIGLRNNGVNIVATNNSWGGDHSTLLREVIREHEARDILFVAAAGNEGQDNDLTPHYPSSYKLDNIISVASHGRDGELSGYSNYGLKSVDIAAPGEVIYSTRPNDTWGNSSGTSVAAPFVTGVVGLLKAFNPGQSNADIRDHLLATGARHARYKEKLSSGRRLRIVLKIVDEDNDGIHDRWETENGLDPQNPADALQDPDADGLNNLGEYQNGTRPFFADSDGDGLNDGAEVNVHGTDPLSNDTDNDGLSDFAEVTQYATDPANSDTDGDGLPDGAEITEFATDPNDADTDTDGLTDGWEIQYGFNPLLDLESGLDTDMDGLSNAQEHQQGTNPLEGDTDNDGLGDQDEVLVHGTSPIDADSDGDSMDDGWEVSFGLNPLNAADAERDRDNDGYSNASEFEFGTDPTDLRSSPPIAPWATVQGNPQRTANAPAITNAADFGVRWQKPVYAMGANTDVAVVNQRLLTRSFDGYVSLLQSRDLADGSIEWQRRFDASSRLGVPKIDGEIVFLAHDVSAFEERLEIMRLKDGQTISTIPLLDWADAESLVADDGTIFVRDDETLKSIDIATGTVNWDTGLEGDALARSHALAVNRKFVVLLGGTNLYVFNRKFGRLKHHIIEAECGTWSKPALMLDSESAFVVNGDCVSRFDLKSGTRQWQINRERELREVLPTMDRTSLYFATRNGIESIDLETGASNWTRDIDDVWSDNLVSTLNHVFVPTRTSVVAIDIATHKKVWSYPATGRLAISDAGTLIIKTDSDELISINTDGDDDSDGMPNWWERLHRLNFRNPANAAFDADKDGLSNLDEFNLGSNPRDSDTDADGVSDRDEVRKYSTSPTNPDTDGDGLLDGEEVSDWGTDPLDDDSDGDGAYDGDEVQRYGTDPADPGSAPNLSIGYHQSFEFGMPGGWKYSPPASTGWVVSSGNASDGAFSLKTDNLAPYQRASIEFTRNFAEGEVSFDFNTGGNRLVGSLQVYIDNALRMEDSSPEWKSAALTLPAGRHTIRFLYINSAVALTPAAWIDNVRFTQPPPFAADMNNVLVVSRNRLHEFDRRGKLVRQPLEIPNADNARSLAVTMDHRIVIADPPRLHFFDPETERFDQFVHVGWEPHWIELVAGIATYDDYILVVHRNAGLLRFGLDGQYIDKVLKGKSYTDISVGLDGFLYAVRDTGRIDKVSLPDLSIVRGYQLGSPTGIAASEDGSIFTVDGIGRLQKFKRSGKFVESLDAPFDDALHDLAVSPFGDLFFSSRYENIGVSNTDMTSIGSFQARTDNGNVPAFVTAVTRRGFDRDGDGLPDWWEKLSGLDADDPSDAASDADADGLTGTAEFLASSDPRNADTDGDGLPDGMEVDVYGTSPIDSDKDRDNVSDFLEVMTYNTDPLSRDTDGDGLDDGLEINELASNPLSDDSDGDGMTDAWEHANGLDLNKSFDKNWDPDADGLTNLQEFLHGTAIREPDSDFDGLTDGDEINSVLTDPVSADTDGDELFDGWEVQYGFDPLSPVEADDDPDVDGFSNRQEFYAGSDPLFAASVPAFSPWSTHQGNNRHDGYVPVILDTTALSEIWNRNFSGDDIDDFNQVASDSGVVWATTYLRSRAQSLLAIDGLTGDTIWSYVFDHDSDVTAPSLVDGDVYVQTDEFVYGFRGLTGKQKTRIPFRTEPQVLAAPAVKGGKLYSFAGYDGGTASISTSGKKVIWTHELRTRAGWSPVVKDNRVIFYGNTGLSVLNRTTGNARYVIPDLTRSVSGSRIQPSPVLDAFGNVIVTQHNRVIYFDLESRSIAWETRLGTGDLSQATLANGVVYVVAQGDLVALDANDGSELWRWTPNSPANGQMLATVDHVVLGLENRTVAFNIRTQKVDWKYPLSGELALGNDGILYISGDSSRIAAIRAFGGPDLGGMPGE